MSSLFRDQLHRDLAVFLNSAEFAETHNINGIDGVTCILETEDVRSLRSDLSRFEGVYKGTVLLLIRESDWQWGEPAYNRIVTLDRTPYSLKRFELSAGIYEMLLEAIR